MIVYILTAVLVKNSLSVFTAPTVTFDQTVFKSLSRCERNRDYNYKELRKVYDKVSLSCIPKEIHL